jgi:hypothetical protein
MLRRGERAVVLGAIVAVILAAVAGVVTAPTRDLEDPRLSTYLAGPHGAKGLAQTLRHLGMTVEQRRRPYFDLAGDSGQPRRAVLLAFLDIDPPTARELAAVRDYVTYGGRVFVAGVTGIESCFGYHSRRVRRGAQADSTPVASGAWRLPRAGRVLARIPAESLAPGTAERLEGDECAPRFAARVDTLLSVRGGRPLTLRLGFPTGGEAVLLADGAFLTNRSLKETDAGLAVLPWFADGRTRRVVVDEYHQGFGAGGSLLAASAAWLVGHPPGWAILQLVGVALVALAVVAVRFGPPRAGVERRRRSPLEHLEALAAGLEGAGGVDTAVALTVSGLRRRLGRAGALSVDAQRSWLAALELGLPTATGRNAVRELQRTINQPGGPERALAAAQAVEDVWEELRPQTTRAAS